MINVNIRMEKDVKDELSKFCYNTGLSLSTLFNIFAKKVVHDKKIPFEISYGENDSSFIDK